MEGDKIQPKHTKRNPIVLCAGDRKTSVGSDFPRSPETMQKVILSQQKICWGLQHEEISFGKAQLDRNLCFRHASYSLNMECNGFCTCRFLLPSLDWDHMLQYPKLELEWGALHIHFLLKSGSIEAP